MQEFFNEMMEQSEIKTNIVEKYFKAWSTIMNIKSSSDRLGYIDLFSGPGYYADGKESTPIKIIRKCLENHNLRNKIVMIFNDANPEFAQKLRESIEQLANIESLKYKPVVNNFEVGEDIVKQLKGICMIPSISFVDPWGYKGLTSDLIKTLIKDWGCDCIFFFNYNRINMGITNTTVKQHIDSIFGKEGADLLRNTIKDMNPRQREETILNELTKSLSDNGTKYVLPFQFIRSDRASTSHYLIFTSKSALGYTIMKDIMSSSSSEKIDGVGSFSYIPVSDPQLSFLFSYCKPLDDLGGELLNTFANKSLTVKKIFESHNIGTNYTLANYKEALRRLEDAKKITVFPPASSRRVIKGIRTMADGVTIKFPKL